MTCRLKIPRFPRQKSTKIRLPQLDKLLEIPGNNEVAELL